MTPRGIVAMGASTWVRARTRTGGFAALVVLAGLAGLVLLTGCTTDNHDLPTLGGSRGPVLSALESVAKTYYDCMRDADLPVELGPNGQGELAIVNFSGSHSVLLRDGNGVGYASIDKEDPAFQQQMDTFFIEEGVGLVIDGVDHSTVYAQCLEKSGYDEQAAWGSSPMMDQAQLAKQVEANNRWTSCARDHGWPAIKDSTMPTDPNQWPNVLLTPTITEEQLRALLTACPNFDPVQQQRIADWWSDPMATGYPDDYLPDPSISFDIDYTQTMDPNTERLFTVLYEQASAYYDSLNEGTNQGGAIEASIAPR